jgi:hypothetical protein
MVYIYAAMKGFLLEAFRSFFAIHSNIPQLQGYFVRIFYFILKLLKTFAYD